MATGRDARHARKRHSAKVLNPLKKRGESQLSTARCVRRRRSDERDSLEVPVDKTWRARLHRTCLQKAFAEQPDSQAWFANRNGAEQVLCWRAANDMTFTKHTLRSLQGVRANWSDSTRPETNTYDLIFLRLTACVSGAGVDGGTRSNQKNAKS